MKKHTIFTIMILLFAVAILNVQGITQVSALAPLNCNELCEGLRVSATETIKAKPDLAVISFLVETKNTVLGEAQSENAERVQNLLMVLQEQNINEDDIKTVAFNIYPEYDFMYGEKFTGYKVINQLKVNVRNIENIGQIVDSATSAGVNRVYGIEFLITDCAGIYNQAIIKAMDMAQQKALSVADAAGVEIKLKAINEISNNYYNSFERVCYANGFDFAVVNTSILHGELKVSATVELVYSINDI